MHLACMHVLHVKQHLSVGPDGLPHSARDGCVSVEHDLHASLVGILHSAASAQLCSLQGHGNAIADAGEQ